MISFRFEEICSKPAYGDLKIKVIPGNHDPGLSNRYFVLDNLEIIDKPRFTWRGAMLDVARHYMPVEFIFKFLDLLAT